jgi:hypothetical protein
MKIILWLLLFAVFFLAIIRYIERHSIYFPMKGIAVTPQAEGLAYEDVYFVTSDGKRLHGWFIPHERARYTLLFCHGNAGNVSHRLAKLSILHDLGVNIFIFDYRGYGRSEGSPCESGFYKDAGAAYRYVTVERKIPPSAIVLYGESIGAAVVIECAGRAAVKALITEEAFTSIRDMAATAFPFIPPALFSSRFDSVSRIRRIDCQKLIIHSVDDEIVPFSLGERLFHAARPPKKFLKLRGGHNMAFLDSETQFREGIKSFLDELSVDARGAQQISLDHREVPGVRYV